MTETPELLRLRRDASVTIDGTDITKHLSSRVIIRKKSQEITIKAKANAQMNALLSSLGARNDPFPIILKIEDVTFRIPNLLWDVRYHGGKAVATFKIIDSIERIGP